MRGRATPEHTYKGIPKRLRHGRRIEISKSGEGVSAPQDLVYLHHPGYDNDNESVLFTLPTCSVNSAGEPCAEYAVAWQGCYVIAINRHGFFTKRKRRESDRAQSGRGLLPGHYYSHLNEDIEGNFYATSLRYRAWIYSPEHMPEA